MKCVICKNKIVPDFGGWPGGHNPWPIKKKGRCCGKCNYEKEDSMMIMDTQLIKKVLKREKDNDQ